MQSLRLISWRRASVALFAILVVIFGDVPNLVCIVNASISGQVTTQNGAAVQFGVTVRLETNSGELVAQQPADSNGHFEFDGLRKLDYHLVVTANGFQTVDREANLRYAGNNLNINVQLTPKSKIQTNKAGVISVDELKVPRRARRLYRKGQHAFKSHKFSQARHYFEQATRDYPCYARAQTDLATLLIITKRHISEAENRLKKAIKCDSSFLNAYIELAQLLNAENRFADSRQVLKQGLNHSPGSWQFHYQMGVACYGMKEYGEAERDLLEARSLNKNPPSILYVKLADVYVRESKYNDAYYEMQTYLRTDPKGRFGPRIRTIMKQMKAAGVLSSGTVSH